MKRLMNGQRRYGVYLFAGYFMLFLTQHASAMRYDAPGFLAQRSSGYLGLAARVNPLLAVDGYVGTIGRRLEVLLVYGFLVIVYLRALRAARAGGEGSAGLGGLLGWVGLFSIPLMLLPYVPDQDIYSYISYGRLSAVYGANPALAPPSAYPQDPFYQYLSHWRHLLAPYGPVWLLFSHGLTLPIAADGLWAHMIAYKLAALGFHALNSLLIWSILGGWKPPQQRWGTLLYAWNPLALIEFAGGAHNDAMMACLILLGIWLAQRQSWRGATVALVAAALVKWVVVLLLPLYGLWVIRRKPRWPARLRAGGQVGAVALAGAIVLYAPYWQGPQVLVPMLTNPVANQTVNSLGDVLVRSGPLLLHWLGRAPDPRTLPKSLSEERIDQIEMRQIAQMPHTPRSARVLARYAAVAAARDRLRAYVVAFSKAVAILATLVAALAVWRRPSLERYVQSAFWLLLATLLFVPWFWPWYLTWPLALGALLDWRAAGQAIVTFTATAPLIYVVPARLSSLGAVLIFLPVFVVVGRHLWRAHSASIRLRAAALAGIFAR